MFLLAPRHGLRYARNDAPPYDENRRLARVMHVDSSSLKASLHLVTWVREVENEARSDGPLKIRGEEGDGRAAAS